MIYASQTHEINKIQQYYILITAWTLPKDFRVKFAAPFGGFFIKKKFTPTYRKKISLLRTSAALIL
jgi:hypothetical protein